jgi:endonuclease IV
MFGSHLSIAGGLHNALLDAEKLGLDTTQVFTENQPITHWNDSDRRFTGDANAD